MSSNAVTTTDTGLLSVINDALPGCGYNQQFYDWAVSAGMKSVSKGTACPTGYIPVGTDVTPSGLKGNGVYDVCVSSSGSSAPMSDGLLKGLLACVSSPIGPSGPKKLTWWQWFLIAIGIFIGVMIGLYAGYKFYSARRNVS